MAKYHRLAIERYSISLMKLEHNKICGMGELAMKYVAWTWDA